MKIAVLVTGVYPANLNREYLNRCVQRFEKHFPNCDVYYQCWDTHLNRHIFKDVKVDILWSPEPKEFKKNPYSNLLEGDNPIVPSNHVFYKQYKRLVEFDDRTSRRRVWQHYGFALLHDSIKEKYDLYIRTRWDAFLGSSFNLQNFIHESEQRVIGV